MDNNNKMKDVLTGGAMGGDSVDLILKAIDDMQEKIGSDFDEKLKNFATLPSLKDLENEL